VKIIDGNNVIPAQAGIQLSREDLKLFNSWIPASAGMTGCGKFLTILFSTQLPITKFNSSNKIIKQKTEFGFWLLIIGVYFIIVA
jgi:hypothetical protein